jgi:hypothetical protein
MYIPNVAMILFLVVIPGPEHQASQTVYTEGTISFAHEIAEVRPRFSAISQITSAYEFALIDGWDGARAMAVSPECLAVLQEILDEMPPMTVWPEVGPLTRGGINLVWNEGGKYLYLEVRNDGAAHLYYNIDGVKWEAVRPVRDREIREKLFKAMAQMGALDITYIRSNSDNTSAISIPA